jgi:hypothetical protein
MKTPESLFSPIAIQNRSIRFQTYSEIQLLHVLSFDSQVINPPFFTFNRPVFNIIIMHNAEHISPLQVIRDTVALDISLTGGNNMPRVDSAELKYFPSGNQHSSNIKKVKTAPYRFVQIFQPETFCFTTHSV